MRVAALYDVHGNLPALEAVLAEIDDEDVDAIVSGGDLIWGPLPAECLALLRARDARFLAGNCERDVLAHDRDVDAWCDARLDDEARAFVADWPATVEVDGALYCHATPRSDTELLTAGTPEDVVAEVLEDVDAPLVVCGHTHHQYDRVVAATRLVNAGSVGLPYEGVAAAFWALVTDDQVELRRTGYDVAAGLERLRASGYPGVDELLHASLVEPMSRDDVIAHWERVAGRAA